MRSLPAMTFRGLVAASLVLLAVQCTSTPPAPAVAAGPASPGLALNEKAPADVEIFCDPAPRGLPGIQFTLLARTDRKIELGFPEGSETLELKRGISGTAVFLYDAASDRVTMKTSNGQLERGPKEVPKRGAFNPIRRLGSITKQPALPTQDGRPRTLVTGRNVGLEFSFTLIGSR